MSSTLPAHLTLDERAHYPAPLDFTHGTLTWAGADDEMIGTDVPPVSAQQRMVYGVRVAFNHTCL